MEAERFTSIDEYIAAQPAGIQAILRKLKKTIVSAAPNAIEAIRYNMPAFLLEGNLVYFAAHAKHFGLYPAPVDAIEFRERLAKYGKGKATAQFKYDEPVPWDLITDIVKFRMDRNLTKAALKKKKSR